MLELSFNEYRLDREKGRVEKWKDSDMNDLEMGTGNGME